MSDSAYKNYDLVFDWKINKGGNSGIFINVVERPDLKATWADSVAKTHFAAQPEFRKHSSGHLALQDWQKEIAFKNIKIKEL